MEQYSVYMHVNKANDKTNPGSKMGNKWAKLSK